MGKVRDRFMAAALQAGIIAGGANRPRPNHAAERAASYADAMMKERKTAREGGRQAEAGLIVPSDHDRYCPLSVLD